MQQHSKKKSQKRFKYNSFLAPNQNRARLARHLTDRSNPIRSRLESWLGGGVKITGCVDVESLLCTLTFTDNDLGTLGETDLVFAGNHAMPSEVRCRVCDDGDESRDDDPDVEARKALMKRIFSKTEELFILRIRWRVSYYSGDERIGACEIIDGDMARVKNAANNAAPPGTDMIKLRTPDGKTLIRTAKKQWTREG